MNLNCNIQNYTELIESGKIRACRRIKAAVKHVKKCFEAEDLYVDEKQLESYLNMQKYFSWNLIEWEKFVITLHLCTYVKSTGRPRWPKLVVFAGRGSGKDGMIAFESLCAISGYNGIPKYDVDICANSGEQATRPANDLRETFENPKNYRVCNHFFSWTQEKIVSRETGGTIKGRTNNPKTRDGMRSGMIVFNEVHEYQNYKNIKVFKTGKGKVKHPREAIYSSYGDVREGPFDDYVEKADNVLFRGKPDKGTLYLIFSLDEKEEVHDKKNWVKSTPTIDHLPDLMNEVEEEYEDWLESPFMNEDFMTKRMGIPEGQKEAQVTEWDNIAATNKPLPDLAGKECVVGIDYMKVSDFLSINAHFKIGDERYDINHSWICTNSKDLPRITAPWKQWAAEGFLTVVDEVEIKPEVVIDYITELKKKYIIKYVAIDDFRYALLSNALKKIGVDTKIYKNLKLVRPSDIMRTATVIDSCFLNGHFTWGDNPVLRWGTNNTKLIRYGRTLKSDDEDKGNFVYGKIEAKSRKTDPFMALVASMTVENELSGIDYSNTPYIGFIGY